jgi:hypothetical protein
MHSWKNQLKYDPLPSLLESRDEALLYFVQRDLLDEDAGDVRNLWELLAPQKMLRKQNADGSWPRAGKHKHAAINYPLIETWKQLRYLVEQYGFTRQHPQLARAAEFVFSCQTDEGDIRGMLANQHATYYTGAILSLLIQAGYADDERIEKGFQWLLSMRQDDLGWTVPLQTHKLDRASWYRLTSEFAEPLELDRTKPFSHNCTGMVIRAFAVHPTYKKADAARTAANLLKSRFFQPDAYTSYKAASYWVRFQYPFWWNNLVAALDSVTRIGLTREDKDIANALDWLQEHQKADGLWKISYTKPGEKEKGTPKERQVKLWVTLAICRVLKRLFG